MFSYIFLLQSPPAVEWRLEGHHLNDACCSWASSADELSLEQNASATLCSWLVHHVTALIYVPLNIYICINIYWSIYLSISVSIINIYIIIINITFILPTGRWIIKKNQTNFNILIYIWNDWRLLHIQFKLKFGWEPPLTSIRHKNLSARGHQWPFYHFKIHKISFPIASESALG